MIAFNEANRIEQSLRSIEELDSLVDYEIIVVDDGSSDNTCQVVRNFAKIHNRIIVHPLGRNRGRGAARASGVSQARGRYIAMVDADILLPSDWWERCRNAIDDYDVVSGVAVPDGDVVFLSDRFHLEPKVAEHATSTTGSNALFKREVFDVVHYEWDRRNGEDVALSHDLEKHGLQTYVVPGLIVRHHENKSLIQTVSWLFESGIGASRQLEVYKMIRRPDQAAAIIAALILNVLVPRRNGRQSSVSILLIALATIAALHVRTKFVFRRNNSVRYALAVTTDALLIFSYVSGRIVGHGYVCRRSVH